MTRFIASRFLQGLVSLLAVTIIVFLITRLTGDPVHILLPPEAGPEQYEAQRQRLGLDRPLSVQYWTFISQVAQGDLGTSVRANRSVSAMIAQRVPATLELGGMALLLSFVVGVPTGLYAAYWKGGRLDRTVRFFAVLGQAAPTFWVGLVLVLIFAVYLGWLPSGGRGTWQQLLLPAITLAWSNVAGVTRLMRSSILETFETDYIRFARIKGVSERNVLWKHGLRNAGLPVLTFGGVLAATLVTGSIVVEVVFVWPGLGSLLIEGIQFRDFPMVQGGVLVLSAAYVAISLFVDVLYAYLNPRIRAA